jgi:hypothetical protein
MVGVGASPGNPPQVPRSRFVGLGSGLPASQNAELGTRVEDIVPGAHSTSFHRRPAQPTTGSTPGRRCWAAVRGLRCEGSAQREGSAQPVPRRGDAQWLKVKVPEWTDTEEVWKRAQLDGERRTSKASGATPDSRVATGG